MNQFRIKLISHNSVDEVLVKAKGYDFVSDKSWIMFADDDGLLIFEIRSDSVLYIEKGEEVD